MRSVILATLATAAVAAAKPDCNMSASADPIRAAFEDYKVKFNRNYVEANGVDNSEYRFNVFAQNYRYVEELNRQANGETTFTVHNIFGDMTREEKYKYTGYKPNPANKASFLPAKPVAPVQRPANADPAYVDWKSTDVMPAIRDQGQCGSCWAYSAEFGVSTQYKKQNRGQPKTQHFSTQQIVDCDMSDSGCSGGDLPPAYEYMASAGGLMSEEAYPYKATDGTCKFDKSKIAVKVKGFEWAIPNCLQDSSCNKQDEFALAERIKERGPAAICVMVADDWFYYSSGILKSSCTHGYYTLNHCIGLVNSEKRDGQNTWVIANSWGESWGEKGFASLPFGVNSCGVASEAAFAIVA